MKIYRYNVLKISVKLNRNVRFFVFSFKYIINIITLLISLSLSNQSNVILQNIFIVRNNCETLFFFFSNNM